MKKRPKLSLPALPAWRRSLATRLLSWFDEAARDLPWRQTQDLYAVWVSEVMLQQTQVATVVSYWKRFLARFPNVASLAAAEEQDVLRLWEGLGYYRRARQLHAAAQQVTEQHGGQFPITYDAVRGLPGIGRYTAGAILSIGLDQRLPILEANTIRVLSRLTAFRGDPASSAGQKHLWKIAETILPSQRCGTFNQALMELGSEICTPKSPACERCPVTALCAAHKHRLVEKIPRAAKPTKYEDVTEVAVIIRHRGRLLLRRCQPGQRWAGLWDFPRFAAANGKETGSLADEIIAATRKLLGIEVIPGELLATMKHGVTRFRITLHCYEARLHPRTRLRKSTLSTVLARWVSPRELHRYPLSTTGRQITRLLDASESRHRSSSSPRSAE